MMATPPWHVMRSRLALAFLTLVNATFAELGGSLDAAKKKYGPVVETSTYRPDLYPTSYVFRSGDAKLGVTPLPGTISHLDVFFAKTPKETPEALLERFSGRAGWMNRPLSDPAFEREFPHFNTTEPRNRFYVADGAYALVQRDVGEHKLVLSVHTGDYLQLLAEYRKRQKKG